MKIIFSILILFCSTWNIRADSNTNLLSLTYVNGTNNGGVYWASNCIVPLQKILAQSLGITNGGATATNFVRINLQWSVDAANTNWTTVATFYPSTTNATVDLFSTNFGAIRIPFRAQVITTNTIGVAVFKEQ